MLISILVSAGVSLGATIIFQIYYEKERRKEEKKIISESESKPL